MTTHTTSVSRLIGAGAALLLLLFTIAACGSDPTPTPTPQPAPTATPQPAPTTEPETADTQGAGTAGMAAGAWRTDVAVGSDHGDRAANASITLPDGSTGTLESAAGGRAVLLYFFATWWPSCRGESRTLDTLYDGYKDDVEIIHVAFNEDAAKLDSYAREQGYDWIFAEAEQGTQQAFNIRSQATYVGIGRDGTIVASSAGGSGKDWPSILDQLTSS